MARSNGIPRQRGLGVITRIIRARARAVSVTRVETSTGSLDEVTETTTDHTESLWLFDASERVADEVAGERIEGNLGALAVADGTVDIQHTDRIVHGGVEYEVDTVVGHPEDDDADASPSPETDFWLVDMVRRQ